MRFRQLTSLSNDFFRHFDLEKLDIVSVQSRDALAVFGAFGMNLCARLFSDVLAHIPLLVHGG